jgi:hypothetical protein
MPTFEELCARAEATAGDIEKLAKQLQRAAVAMKKAARDGNPGKIRQAALQIDEAAAMAQQVQDTPTRAWPLSETELTELLKGDYVDQLIDKASAAGVTLSRLENNCLAAFPVILQIFADSRTLKIDNKRLSTLHPTIAIDRLRASQKKSRSHPEKFIEVLYRAYRLVVGEQIEQGTTLVAVYDALTVLPEARTAYGKPEFTRDIYELDSSSVKSTRNGITMTLSASTGTRSKGETLTIIAPSGMPKSYYGIRFEKAK